MAHEAGHVVARHSARSMVAAYGVEQIAALAAGKNPGLLTKVTTTIAGRGLLLSHTRGEETEADEFVARYSSAAGYDPRGFVTFFEKLKKSEGSTPAILNYLSDHPATEDRIAHINQYVAEKKLGGSNLGTEAYAKFRKRLATLPPSPAKAPAGSPPASPAGAPPAPPAGAPPPA
jgi:predicted Zn-dependent protease